MCLNFSIIEVLDKIFFNTKCILTQIHLILGRPNLIGVHAPVAADLAKTVMLGSDGCENLISVLNSAKYEKLSFKIFNIY